MSVQIKGAKQLIDALRGFGDKTAKPAIRKAHRAGLQVLKAAVKAEVPVDKGVLKRTEDSKLKNRGFSFTGIVGSSVDKLKAANAQQKRPTNLDWLVEYGHVAPDGRFIPPSGAMRRAAASSMPQAEQRVIAVLKSELERVQSNA